MTFSRRSKCATAPVSQRSISFLLVALFLFQNLLFALPATAYAGSARDRINIEPGNNVVVTAPIFDIPVDSAIVQSFDVIGTSATATLPVDFRVDRPTTVRTVGSYASAGTATTAAGGAGLSSTATN